MSKQRQIKADQLVKALAKNGFNKLRTRGSHLLMGHSDGRKTVIPMHGGRDIPTGTLKAILKDVNLNFDDLFKK